LAAGINLDSINIFGRTSDLGMEGFGKSSLDAVVTEIARIQGRSVHGDPFPDRGSFYRSDQFELARIGVPVAALRGGPDFTGRPPGWGASQSEAWEERDYHQVSDEYHDQWDLSGGVQDAQLQAILGLRVADAPELPKWNAGDEFEAVRKQAAR
jgi:Zn-dependent M28 family amino/carboxypeptidase